MTTKNTSHSLINCMIVDDDPFMQDLLQDKLAHFKDIHIVAVASSGNEAYEKLKLHSPELLFLDVEMPDFTGFELLEKLDKINFKTIFVTSYSHYAIKAIRFNALDYILKPIDLQELSAAIERFRLNRQQFDLENLQHALKNRKQESPEDLVITIGQQDGSVHFKLKDILYMEGDRNYSYIHTSNFQKTLVSKTLSVLEELVNEAGFYRCHKSYLVNKSHITSEIKMNAIEIANEIKIPVSRRRSKPFEQWLAS